MSEYGQDTNRDSKWFAAIGFVPCMTRDSVNLDTMEIEPEDGWRLLMWDLDRLNLLESNYVERTGIQPPPITDRRK